MLLRKPQFVTTILNLYIMAFLIVLNIHLSQQVELIMLYCSPIVCIWMFYTVISSTPIKMQKV